MSKEYTRRKILQSVGTSAVATSFAGLASAKGSSKRGVAEKQMFPLVVQDGKVDLSVTKEKGKKRKRGRGKKGKKLNSQDVLRQHEANSGGVADGEKAAKAAVKPSLEKGKKVTGEDAAYILAKAVEIVNETIEQDYFNVNTSSKIQASSNGKHRSGNVKLEPTQKFIQLAESVQTPHALGTSCGVSKYEFDGIDPLSGDLVNTHKFYTNDEDTQEISYRLQQGTVTAGFLAGLCGVSGVGTPFTVAATIISAIGQLLVTEYNYENEGCGVITQINHNPATVSMPIAQLTYGFNVRTQE